MDYYALVPRLIGEKPEFNPACFNFSESIARAKNLWRDDRKMPTQSELDAENDLWQAELIANSVIEQNKETRKAELKAKIKDNTAKLADVLEILEDLI